MRVLVLTPHYPPRHGGTSDYTKRFVAELRHRGAVVQVVTKEGGNAEEPDARTFEGPWSLRSFGWFHRLLKEFGPDAVVVQYGPYSFNKRGPGLPVTSLLVALVSLHRVPLLVYGHELYSPWRESLLRAPWGVAQRLAVIALIARSRSFIVTIESRRSRLVRLLPWWRRRINAISVPPTLSDEPIDAAWRNARGVPDGVLLVASMGVDDPTKGADSLAAVADGLADAGVQARVIAVGGLQSHSPRVEAWGYVSRSDAWNLVCAADLFVAPYSDGVSARRTTVVNALMAGSAILTTDGVNTDPRIFSPEALALVPAGDTEALVRRAVELSGSVQERARLKRAARDLGLREFGWDAHMSRWTRLLADVTGDIRQGR